MKLSIEQMKSYLPVILERHGYPICQGLPERRIPKTQIGGTGIIKSKTILNSE